MGCSKCAGELCERLADLERLYRLLAQEAWSSEHADAYEGLAHALCNVANALAAQTALPKAAAISAVAEVLAQDALEETSPLREALSDLRSIYERLHPVLAEAELLTGHADHELVGELLETLTPAA